MSKIIGTLRLHCIDGLRDLFAQIDKVLTFHFCHGILGGFLMSAWKTIPAVGTPRAPNSGWILGAFIKTFPGKSLTKMKGKDHIYLGK